ncbi:CpaF family protein [Vibrio nigripulchritudo]|uniref:CpaF family protein n=1 Tax=Vibrio nigripulchritudo TaxID=28173 RepID=UPI0005F9C331|nr:CpaF family protein [Vibrio nigripulchritudo]KJY80956.1 pilus assembly protein CpaF [Vibrio nigripulchritudo]
MKSEEQPNQTFEQQRLVQVHELRKAVLESLDPTEAVSMSAKELEFSIYQNLSRLAQDSKVTISMRDQQLLTKELMDDILGLGPLEPLIRDANVSDIMVNGPDQVYVEKFGKIQITDVKFRDQEHVHNVAQRIASAVGRRIDEASPMVDARLEDGSRVNVIAPPLSLSGTVISIRKFSKKTLSLDIMAQQENLSDDMAKLLASYVSCKLNVLVSGGTGAGKTTLLNALSKHIGDDERLITIEDAAEIQLQQPHVISLETRSASVEGSGQVNQTDLVKNALRMRPDRILLGEVRGEEVFDMLQAMNTGHDGSLSTVHANTPADALVRLENMMSMSQSKLSSDFVRKQIASSIDVIVQVERCRDGVRRITEITEISGYHEGEFDIQTQFKFVNSGEIFGDRLVGEFICKSNNTCKADKLTNGGQLHEVQALLTQSYEATQNAG